MANRKLSELPELSGFNAQSHDEALFYLVSGGTSYKVPASLVLNDWEVRHDFTAGGIESIPFADSTNKSGSFRLTVIDSNDDINLYDITIINTGTPTIALMWSEESHAVTERADISVTIEGSDLALNLATSGSGSCTAVISNIITS